MRCCDCKLRNECMHKSNDDVAFAACGYLNNWLYNEMETLIDEIETKQERESVRNIHDNPEFLEESDG